MSNTWKSKEPSETFVSELLIKADSRAKAEAILDTALKSKDWKVSQKFKKLNDYQLVTLTFTANNEQYMNDAFYDVIKNSTKIGIVKDGFRRIQQKEVSDKIYEVENELRKILLYASDFISTYYDLLQKIKNDKKRPNDKSLIHGGYIDSMISSSELGEIINIFDIDLNHSNEKLTRSELRKIFENNIDFKSCKKEITEKYKIKTVWQSISHNLLKNNDQKWCDIKNKLDEFRKLRNKIAHYRTLMPKEKKRVIELGDEILENIKIKPKVSQSDIRSFEESLSTLRNTMSNVLSQYNIDYAGNVGKAFQNAMSQYNFGNMNEAISKLTNGLTSPVTEQMRNAFFSITSSMARLQNLGILDLPDSYDGYDGSDESNKENEKGEENDEDKEDGRQQESQS
jgi:hypothetical protein